MKNTFVKVLSFLMALTMIVGTLGTVVVFAADEHTHTQGDLIEVVEPTCITPGFSRYECSDPSCPQGEFIKNPKPASADLHEFVYSPEEPATCLQNSFTAGEKCKYCGLVPEGSLRTEGNDQKAHVFVGTEYAPTCTAAGKVVYKCTSCNKVADDLKKDGKVLQAQLDEMVTINGTPVWKYAERTLDAALGHNYVWSIEKAPKTNTDKACEDGLSKGICANCGDVKTQVIAAHTADVWVKINEDELPCIEWNKEARWCKFCKTVHPEDTNKKQQSVGHEITEKNVIKGEFTDDFVKAYEGDGITFAKLYAWGYTLGQKITDRATCTEAGYVLFKCSCGEVVFMEEPATGHNFVDGAYVVPTDCTKPIMREQTCSSCNLEREVQHAPAQFTSHNDVKVEETIAACGVTGVLTTACDRKIVVNGIEYPCNHTTTAYADALKHTYGTTKTLYSGGCTNGVWVVTCTQPGCAAVNNNADEDDDPIDTGYYKVVSAPTGDAVKHTWGSKVTYAATCTERNYYTQQCTKCDYYRTTKDAATTTAGSAVEVKLYESNAATVATNHTYVHFGWADEANAPDSLCAPVPAGTTYIERVYCSSCQEKKVENTITRIFTPYEHDNVVTGYVTGSDDNKTVVEGGRAPLCNLVGYEEDGKVCKTCKTVIQTPTEIPMDEKAHATTPKETDKVGTIVEATCQSTAYQMYYYSCCKKTLAVSLYDEEDADTEKYAQKTCEAGYTLVKAKAPTCTADGNHAYYKCKWCNSIQPNSVIVDDCTYGCSDAAHFNAKLNNSYSIPAIGHDFASAAAAVPFRAEDESKRDGAVANLNCYIPYTAAHKQCTRGCGFVLFNGTEYNLNVAAQKTSFLEAARVMPHGRNAHLVTKEGVAANCATPGVMAGDYCTVCQANAWVIPATGSHTYSGYTEAQEATKIFRVNMVEKSGSWVVGNCTLDAVEILECKDCTARTVTFYDSTRTTHDWSAYTNDTRKGPICKFDLTKTRICNTCNIETSETVLQENGAKTGCYTTKGLADKPENRFYLSRKCDEIANFFGWKCDKCGETMSKELAVHTPVQDSAPATCTEAGYKINYCKGCGLTHTNTAVDFYPDFKHEIIYPTGDLLEGSEVDYEHDLTNGIVLEHVDATYDAAGYTKYICADCNETVVKDLPKLEKSLVETITASKETVAAGEEFTVTYAYAGKAETIKSLEIDVDYDSTKLAFVKAEVNADLEGLNIYYADQGTKVGVVLVVANDSEGNERTVTTSAEGTVLFTLTFVAKKTAYGEASIEGEKVTVNALGDLNDDGILTSDDAYAIYNHITTQTAYADVNLDGMVSVEDVEALAQFIAAGKTVAAYLEMVGESADVATVEDEVFALLTAGRLNDINNDKFANETDAYKLIEMVKAYLAKDFNVLGDMTTLADVVATVNANPAV